MKGKILNGWQELDMGLEAAYPIIRAEVIAEVVQALRRGTINEAEFGGAAAEFIERRFS